MIIINILAPHPDDLAEGDATFIAYYTTHSITRAYHWHGKGDTAESAAQSCVDSINASRRRIAPDCQLYALGDISEGTVVCAPKV